MDQDIRKEIKLVSDKLDRLMDAVVGNKALGIDGIIYRLDEAEKKVDKIERMIERGKGYLAGALFVGSCVGFIVAKIIDSALK